MSHAKLPTDLMPLTAAVKLATGRSPHLSTILRWATRGCHGVRLRTWVMGGRRLTNPASVTEFVNASTDAANGEQPSVASYSEVADAAADELERELAAS